ncbi:hypothetical protein PZA18_02020 [Chitinimonas sp. DQS-5]|uniref:Uncharacterized protein n=1 Tax=Parachitinimonas caeni TaxID=3031301 RepID=A0ABT7DRY5_9NEIS|nr:hypothetical protein [Parachitinimonas caeni]
MRIIPLISIVLSRLLSGRRASRPWQLAGLFATFPQANPQRTRRC